VQRPPRSKPKVDGESQDAHHTRRQVLYPGGLARDFFTDNLLVRVHFIVVKIRWNGLAPWEFEFPFPGSRTSTFPGEAEMLYPANRVHILRLKSKIKVNYM